MRFLAILLCALLANCLISLQVSSENRAEGRMSSAQYAEAATVRALDFSQGDLATLTDAKDDFTSKGWSEFMKKLDGWLDDKGAPKFTSTFSPSGKALDIRREGGVLYFTIPGILKHASRKQHGGVSTTNYRVEIDIQIVEKTLKIQRLKQRTCGGAKTVTSCR